MKFVVLLTIGVLLCCAPFVDWNSLLVRGTLNDQIVYVSVARNLAETGTLQSNILYPAMLSQNAARNYYYLPGHFATLAAAYALFKFSPAVSLLPSLAAFVLAAALTFWISRQLFGDAGAWAAWAMFALFPPNMIFAFTAMSELTTLASVLVAFAIFLKLPARWRVWLGPAALALPLLFRETNLGIGIVMAGIVWQDSGRRWRPVAVFGLLGLAVAAAVWMSPLSAGRPSALTAQLYGNTYDTVYGNAFALTGIHLTPLDWARAIRSKALLNLGGLLVNPFTPGSPGVLEILSLYFILSGMPLSVWMYIKKRDEKCLSIGLTIGALVVVLACFYTFWAFRGVRVLLYAEPFVALLWADFLCGFGLTRRRGLQWLAGLLFFGVAVGSFGFVFLRERELNRQAVADTAFLESLHLDERGVLISPYQFSFDFVLRHHPLKWSFLPSNAATLRLLDSRYPVSTVILPENSPETQLTGEDLNSIGLMMTGKLNYGGQALEIFQVRR